VLCAWCIVDNMAPKYVSYSLLIPSFVQAVLGASIPLEKRSSSNSFAVESVAIKAFAKPAIDAVTDRVVALRKTSNTSRSSSILKAIRQANQPNVQVEEPDNLQSALDNSEYLTDIVFDGQTLSVIVDTGSSDTWLIQNGFKCVNDQGATQPASACNFGPIYNGSFSPDNLVPDTNFNISYGDGEFVTGRFGYADITVAGIKVPHQQAALGNYAYWNGDGISSGLLGLAYASITSQYAGSDPTKDGQRVEYDPIFTTMYKDNLSSPSFSLAIERNVGGYLAFGGIPPLNITSEFAAAPIEILKTRSGRTEYNFYALTPKSFSLGSTTKTNTDQYIVDSGTTLVYASPTVTTAINKLFSPPATSRGGLYYVNCNAKAPKFAVTGVERTLSSILRI